MRGNGKKGLLIIGVFGFIACVFVGLFIATHHFSSKGDKKSDQEIFTLTVNYDRSISDGIKAGNYNWVNPDITEEHFPAEAEERGTKSQIFTLYHFSRYIESNDAIVEMNRDGYRPATIRELLAFGEANSEPQRRFSIIALSSIWVGQDSHHNVAYLDGFPDYYYLDLNWYGPLGWLESHSFLAVHK